MVVNYKTRKLYPPLPPTDLDTFSPQGKDVTIAVNVSESKIKRDQFPSIEKFTEAEFWNVYFWGYIKRIEAKKTGLATINTFYDLQ